MVFDDGAVSAFNWAGEVSRKDIIDAGLYDGDLGEWLRRPVDIRFGNAVTSIGDWTFNNCNFLTSITIPASVVSIGDGAFTGGASLTSIAIPESMKSLGRDAFS